MPGQIERELHARRIFREPLIDAELEEEGAALMAQHDAGGDRGIADAQGHDFALIGLGERDGGAAYEDSIAVRLDQRGAAMAFPAAGFEREEYLQRGSDLLRRARHLELDRAMLGQPIPLPTQLLQLLAAQRVVQRGVAVVRRV